MMDAWRYSWTGSRSDILTITCSSCSTAPRAHRSFQIERPANMSFLRLPRYSPELDPAERWFQEFRRSLSNRAFESVALIQDALSQTLRPYWERPSLLKRLTGYSWWVQAVEEAL